MYLSQFSCREQIEQETDRKGLHLAQVLQMALREGKNSKPQTLPEKKYVDEMKLRDPHQTRKTIIAGAAIGLVIIGLLLIKNKKILSKKLH